MGKLSKLSKAEQTIFNRITIKKFKEGFGHDLMGYYCDVYLDNKKVGYVNDDGWGGDVTVTHETDKQKEIFEGFLVDNKVANIMHKKLGWDNFNIDKINIYNQGIGVVEVAVDTKTQIKFQKKIDKLCLSNIVFGTDYQYSSQGWKKIDLETVVKHPRIGVRGLQELYYEIKLNLTKDERIFNTNLEELGIKL